MLNEIETEGGNDCAQILQRRLSFSSRCEIATFHSEAGGRGDGNINCAIRAIDDLVGDTV